MDLVPGVSVGPFALGATLGSAMAALRALAAASPDHGAIDFVCAKALGGSNPRDILFKLSSKGILLRVDADQQTLRLIELFSLQNENSIAVSFQGVEIASARTAPSLRHIFRHLGPTYPGITNAKHNEYILAYPGIAFVFPLAQQAKAANDSLNKPPPESLASRIFLFDAQMSRQSLAPDFILATPPPLLKARASDFVTAYAGVGIKFPSSGVFLRFGDTAQDVLASMGSPDAVYNKTADVAAGVATFSGSDEEPGYVDEYCIWNYFGLGLDIVFDSTGSSIERIILHTNLPLHYAFGRYTKCRFDLELLHSQVPLSGSLCLWETVRNIVGEPVHYMEYNRDLGHGPFAGSEYFGYESEGLIVEVVDGISVASIVMTRV